MNKYPTKQKPFRRINGVVQRVVQPKKDRDVIQVDGVCLYEREQEIEYPDDVYRTLIGNGPRGLRGIRRVGV